MVFDDIRCYTDSHIFLAWIKSLEKEFKIFIQNRVLEIRKCISPHKWFYCNSEVNPADLLTRTKLGSLSNGMWFDGPEILYNPTGPVFFDLPYIPINEKNLDKVNHVVIRSCSTIDEGKFIDNIIDIKRYNDLLKLYRVTAYVKLQTFL